MWSAHFESNPSHLTQAWYADGLNQQQHSPNKSSNERHKPFASVPYVNRTLKNAYVPLKFITKLRNLRFTFANGKCVE